MCAFRYLGLWKHGPITVVRFGEHRILDEMTVNKIADELYAVAERADCPYLLLNFASVVRLSSVMLGKLLMLQRKMEAKGGKLRLCDLEPEVREVFESTKLIQIFDIRDSELDGIKSFAPEGEAKSGGTSNE
jgi:anti-sigma B factor antagonist